jgi:predicted membrane GTPase involved in stress response
VKHDEITQTNLNAVLPLTFDYALAFLKNDNILEVTPKSLRLRNVLLSKIDREWMSKKKLSHIAEKTLKGKGLL